MRTTIPRQTEGSSSAAGLVDFVGYLKHKAPPIRMNTQEALAMGRGIAKRLGSTLTVRRFLELGRQDKILEDALDAAHRKKPGNP